MCNYYCTRCNNYEKMTNVVFNYKNKCKEKLCDKCLLNLYKSLSKKYNNILLLQVLQCYFNFDISKLIANF
jgi:hypothetical protein